MLRPHGRGFLARRPAFGSPPVTSVRGDASKRALGNAQKLDPNSTETLIAIGYYQSWVLHDTGVAAAAFGRVSTMLPGNSDISAEDYCLKRRSAGLNNGGRGSTSHPTKSKTDQHYRKLLNVRSRSRGSGTKIRRKIFILRDKKRTFSEKAEKS